MLAAAYLALNQRGGGSSPPGPTRRTGCEWRTFRVPFKSLWFHCKTERTHDVAAACRVAIADVPVQLRLGALGIWRAGCGKARNNPPPWGGGERWFESSHPDSICARLRQLAERSGLNPDVCGFDSHAGYCEVQRSRQPADQLGSNPGMLWVRFPPSLLVHNSRGGLEAGSQHGLISRTTSVQIRPSRLHWPSTQTWQSEQVESLLILWVQFPPRLLPRKRGRSSFQRKRAASPFSQWSRGPAATTPGLHPGNDGSSPSGITEPAKPQAAIASMVKRNITPRFERGVPGSNPGRGTFVTSSLAPAPFPSVRCPPSPG